MNKNLVGKKNLSRLGPTWVLYFYNHTPPLFLEGGVRQEPEFRPDAPSLSLSILCSLPRPLSFTLSPSLSCPLSSHLRISPLDEPYCRGHDWRQGDWATCPDCKRLRLRTKFGTYGEEIWSSTTYLYLCLECRTRPLPDEFRYKKGDIWQAGEVGMTRCPFCSECSETMRTGLKGSKYENTVRNKCRKCYAKDQTQSPGSGTRYQAADPSRRSRRLW